MECVAELWRTDDGTAQEFRLWPKRNCWPEYEARTNWHKIGWHGQRAYDTLCSFYKLAESKFNQAYVEEVGRPGTGLPKSPEASPGVTDVLMHMITLFNDKNDWRVRAAFFEACPMLAQHMGQNRNSKLMPFLQQCGRIGTNRMAQTAENDFFFIYIF
ncbi:hypothetical protein niasHT_028795 [Heterodera trifolii]|uniref:Phosphatase 2A Regulatory Subunit A helical domain-containing protein n=1 Tax=Heterodera trifolii TaxID=157864 RepID=A0ABD2KQE6_9BILA